MSVMKSKFPCNACISRSFHSLLQGRVQAHAPAHSFAINSLRWASSAQIQQSKRIARPASRDAKTSQKNAHASSIATPKTPQLPPSILKEARAPSSEHHTSNVHYPENNLSSTRPAPLELPDRFTLEIDGTTTPKNRVSYLFHLGKAYVGFYKTGIKNIYYNWKEYQKLPTKLGKGATADIHDLIRNRSSTTTTPQITRQQFQLRLRTQHDLKKLIPFALVFAICGEFTPLLIVALGTSVVPYTCRIPKQVKKDWQKTLSRIENVERLAPPAPAPSPPAAAAAAAAPPHKDDEEAAGVDTKKNDDDNAARLAYVHGLDPFGLSLRQTPVLGPTLWHYWVQPKLRQRMDDIVRDALLIGQEGGVERLETEELMEFCVKIAKVDTMARLIGQDQGTQSSVTGGEEEEEEEVKRTQREVQIFIDEVRRRMMMMMQVGDQGGYEPEKVFVHASRRARSLGVEGVYVPAGGVE